MGVIIKGPPFFQGFPTITSHQTDRGWESAGVCEKQRRVVGGKAQT